MHQSLLDFVDQNRAYWDSLVDAHVASEFYDIPGFLAGKRSLDPMVQAALGAVEGRRLLHLQCHFGQDTLFLAQQGAQVTGVDFAPKAVAAARDLAGRAGLPARFVEGNVLDLDLGEQFEIVFSSWGAIGWLPDLAAWGRTIARHLAPGGRFVLVEGHPILWMMGESYPPTLKYDYSSFVGGTGAPIVEEAGGEGYAGAEKRLPSFGWNHSLTEVFGALVGAGLRVRRFEEGYGVPWEPWPGMVKVGRYWELPPEIPRFPLAYLLEVEKPAGPS